MYKITADLTPYTSPAVQVTPRTGRRLKMARTPESSARLSSVLDQLSVLSHELSLNLDKDVEETENKIIISIKEEDENEENDKENKFRFIRKEERDEEKNKSFNAKGNKDIFHLQRIQINSSLRRKAFNNCENVNK